MGHTKTEIANINDIITEKMIVANGDSGIDMQHKKRHLGLHGSHRRSSYGMTRTNGCLQKPSRRFRRQFFTENSDYRRKRRLS